jgi:outer membrane protein
MQMRRFVSAARTMAMRGWLVAWLMLVVPVYAGDLSSDVRKGATGRDSGDGGYIEVGAGIASYTSPFVGSPEGNQQGEIHTLPFLDINARYQYRGFFAELFSQSLEQFTLGYSFYSSDNWAIDWVGLVQHDEMSEEISEDYRGLNRRRDDFMSGPRATTYFGNYIVQFHTLTDISNTHDGQLYSLKFARHWQYRNWTIHGIVGATYRSRKITNYYFAIDESEASDIFPVFATTSAISYVGEVGLTYPLSEKWVFRSMIRRIDIGSEAKQSPLILDDHADMIATAISYVF